MLQQQQKIEKANNEIQTEITTQQNLKKEKNTIELEIHALAKEADGLENIINGYKENAKIAKEGIIRFKKLQFFLVSSNPYYEYL